MSILRGELPCLEKNLCGWHGEALPFCGCINRDICAGIFSPVTVLILIAFIPA
jgi:hypothetical protein